MTDGLQLEAAYRTAEAHLNALRAGQDEAGPPCSRCAHYRRRSFSTECHHPFTAKGYFTPHDGKTVWSYPDAARARDGVCSSVGALFEHASAARRASVWLRRSWGWFGFVAGITAEILILRWAM